jgi:mRNA interferase MazF
MPQRGEIWLADLEPIRGSEQGGVRPVLIFQNNVVSKFTRTFLTIPVTSNLRRAALPSAVTVKADEGGLSQDSVIICHQLRVLDQTRLVKRLGVIHQSTMAEVESRALFTLGIL